MQDFTPPSRMAATVVALHCSGSDARQWRRLSSVFDRGTEVMAPNLIGTGDTGSWSGAHAFTLADEAAAILALIDALERPVHLVGHSYGGGVALKVALSRPRAIASLSLYEPSAFHILRRAGITEAVREIENLAGAVAAGLVSGAYAAAAETFVDYWNGVGAWAALDQARQQALVRWLPKASLDFRALLEEPTPLSAYAGLNMPVLLMTGARARGPSRRIVDVLAGICPRSTRAVIPGAGHMGPMTHEPEVFGCIARNVATAAAATAKKSAA